MTSAMATVARTCSSATDSRRTTTRVSVGSAGKQANGESANPAISANGRFVAFQSYGVETWRAATRTARMTSSSATG